MLGFFVILFGFYPIRSRGAVRIASGADCACRPDPSLGFLGDLGGGSPSSGGGLGGGSPLQHGVVFEHRARNPHRPAPSYVVFVMQYYVKVRAGRQDRGRHKGERAPVGGNPEVRWPDPLSPRLPPLWAENRRSGAPERPSGATNMVRHEAPHLVGWALKPFRGV